MSSCHSKWILVSLTCLLVSGCQGEPSRIPTKVVDANKLTITLGTPKAEEPPEAEAAPAAGTSSSSESSAPATTENASTASDTTAPPTTEQSMAATTTTESAAAPQNIPATEPAASEKPAEQPEASAGKERTFSGRVSVTGGPVNLRPLVQAGAQVKDAAVCAQVTIPNEAVVVSEDGGLANVVVYMRRAPRGVEVPPPAEEAPELDQKGCVFLPHVQVVRAGVPLQLKNSDPVAHNVNIKGLLSAFNQLVPSNVTEGVSYTFPGAEPLPSPVVCDIHNWMSAWVLALDHPWAAVTDANGNFEIANLPEGELEFHVWHEKKGYIERGVKVNVVAGEPIPPMSFEVDASELTQ